MNCRPRYTYLYLGTCNTYTKNIVFFVRCRFRIGSAGSCHDRWTGCLDEDDNLHYWNSKAEDYVCNVNEDCLMMYATADDPTEIKINQQLDMKCENNKCITRSTYLWSNIPYVVDFETPVAVRKYKPLDLGWLGGPNLFR